ncbi:MAG: phosphodiester glycosidase family protein [Candidatus Binatia bacterium]
MLRRLSIILFLPVPVLVVASVYSQVGNKPAKFKVSDTLSVRDPGSWKRLQEGIEYRKITLERSEPNYFFELKLFRFDTQSATPRIVRSSQYGLKGADVKTLAQRSGAIAAINANYFDDKGRALGFLKAGAQEINRNVSQSSLFTGLFGIRELSPFILHRDQFQSAEVDEALQSGPLLLSQGKPLHVVRGYGRFSRRSVIGIDKKRRLIIAVTAVVFGGMSWSELQGLFSSPQWEIQTPDLLNLDGGGSAQLYFKNMKLEEFVPGTSEVPVAIGFFNK